MSVDYLVASWKEVRDGFVDEVAQIPEDQFEFKATGETRTIAEIIQHVVETQKMLVGECCQPEPNLMRQSFAAHLQEYAPGVSDVKDKQGLIDLLRDSLDKASATILASADRMNDRMRRFDGKEVTRLEFLQFGVSHEMYHRGQFTVYSRLLNIEPVLTQKLKKMFAKAG